MNEHRGPRHESPDEDGISPRWKQLYAELNDGSSATPRRHRRAAPDDDESVDTSPETAPAEPTAAPTDQSPGTEPPPTPDSDTPDSAAPVLAAGAVLDGLRASRPYQDAVNANMGGSPAPAPTTPALTTPTPTVPSSPPAAAPGTPSPFAPEVVARLTQQPHPTPPDTPAPGPVSTAADGSPEATGEEPTSTRAGRHAATSDRGLRLPKWAIGVIALVVLGLLAWLIVGLTSGNDTAEETATSTTTASTTPEPTAVNAASLPAVLCTGQAYAFVDTGKTTEALLADPAALDRDYPGSSLATVPGGCIPGSAEVDAVVLTLGPFPTVEEACAAGKALGAVPFKAYAGNDQTGLTETPCP